MNRAPLGLVLGLAAGIAVLAGPAGKTRAEQRVPCVPVIDEAGWVRIAGQPDLGELGSPRQQPVDFAVWQAADGTWQLWSCIRRTKEAGRERLLYRWEGPELTSPDWRPMGVAMRGDPAVGEAPGGVQAPYVVRESGRYYMFYGDWDNICVALSADGKDFTRYAGQDGRPQLFGEGQGNNARDPMLIKDGAVWKCYYSAMRADSGPRSRGGMFVRESADLLDWSTSDRKLVLRGGSPGDKWWHAECPHVVEHRGCYYLFRTSNYEHRPVTTVYRSDDPDAFGVDDDAKIVATLPIAAPEVVRHAGGYKVAALTPELDGVRVTTLRFEQE